MLEHELQQYLLREYPQENARCEWKEFKNLKNSFCGDEKNDVISYVSAIANMEGGHLVIGVKDKTLEIVGTDISRLTFNGQPANTQSASYKLTEQCTYLSSEGLSIEEFITDDTNKRVWIIHIPKHLPRRPVLAHKKAWQRIEDSLVEMTSERMSVILEEPIYTAKDWSAEIVHDATIDDLDEVAIAKARMMFKKVHSRIPAEEVNAWSVPEFLSNAGVMMDGGITRAAIILLGKPMSVFKLRPAVVRVTWSLRDEKQDVVDYEHFTAPFILTVDQILAKVRNLTMREMPGGTLFPDVMQQYDDYSMREILHNCIAHQDYTLQERINLVENTGFLYYANGGSFIPGTVQKALATHGPQRHYRNECLCNAMVNFNMIDIVGRGIRKIFNQQWERRFPMPDYEIDAAKKEVAVRLYGNVINEKYTKLLKENKDLSLEDCILLDAVQKGHRLNESDAKNLLERGLIEGNYPDLTISLSIARQTKQLPEYTKVKGLERDKIKQMALQFIQNAGEEGTRREFVIEYLREALPARNTKEQNQRLVGNILAEMSNEGLVIQKNRNWYATISKD